MINIIYSTASIPDIIHEYILPSCMDVFYDPKILNILYKNKWNSIFIYENKNFFFHIHTPNQIPSTDYFDIEPWFGYRGPIIVSDSQEFLKKALIKYIDICKERKIVIDEVDLSPLWSTGRSRGQRLWFVSQYFQDFLLTLWVLKRQCRKI